MEAGSRKKPAREHYDAVVVGAGFYGLNVALHLAKWAKKILVVERANAPLTRASFANQARVHGGYHYPRSLTTGFRSHANYQKFLADYADCVDTSFKSYYAIARRGSHVTAKQFASFCRRIEAPLSVAPAAITKEFNGELIEAVYAVEEAAFDAPKLRDRLVARTDERGIEIMYESEVQSISSGAKKSLSVSLGDVTILTEKLFLCTYSALNVALEASKLEVIPLKQEFTEIALVEAPPALQNAAVTVMCGPFFSLMPFPSAGLHSFSHVRYTPHFTWTEDGGHRESLIEKQNLISREQTSHYMPMLQDSQRYLPCLKQTVYRRSLYELKSILPRNEGDDGRPILFAKHHGLKNLFCILGAKIDNIYDVYPELDELMGENG